MPVLAGYEYSIHQSRTMRRALVCLSFTVLLVPAATALPPIHHENAPFNQSSPSGGFTTQAGGMVPVIIQTTETEKPKTLIENAGGRLHGYLPEQAWYATIPSYAMNGLETNKQIGRIIELQAPDKIDRRLKNPGTGKIEARVTLFDASTDLESHVAQIQNLTHRSGGDDSITVTGTIDGIRTLAGHHAVKSILPTPPGYQTNNDMARTVIDAETVQEPPTSLTGDGITGAIWDAGWVGDHEDVNATSKRSIGDDSEHDCASCSIDYHATHVAATMAGNGTLNNDLRGIAPDADIASYEFPSTDRKLSNRKQELKSETEDAVQEYDAVVSQNSWGYLITDDNEYLMGEYIGLSPTFDTLVRGGPNSPLDRGIPIVFSAGNEGDRTPRYNTTTGPGGTAKNTITVGALADTKDMTSYSSWGPTEDNRIKPDLMANGGSGLIGTGVTSAIPASSTQYSYPYQALAGTSMAAPAVSGTIIQLSQFYNETYNTIPAPATMKALLIHTAEDTKTTGPDYKTGWGIVNSSEAVSYLEKDQNTPLLRNGTLETTTDTDTYTISVDPDASSVNITLAWSDYPAQETATKTLVNDLDLVITNSTGHRFYPWTLDGYSDPDAPAQQDQEDHTNPVEQVTIWNPEDTVYTVNVTSSTDTIPEPPQNYSLVLSDQTIDTTPPTLSIIAPTNNSIISGQTDLLAHSSDNQAINTTTVTIANESGDQWSGDYNTTIDTTTLTDGDYTITFTATDMNGNTNESTRHVTVNNDGPQLTPRTPDAGAFLNTSFWINATWDDTVSTTSYTLYNETQTVKNGQLNDTIDISTIEDGSYTIDYSVEDTEGHITETERLITIDRTAPTLTTDSPTDNQAIRGSLLINSSADDTYSPVTSFQYQLQNSSGNQTAWRSLNTPDTIDSTQYQDGSYNITIEATDAAGNQASETIEGLTIDNTAPVATMQFNLTQENQSTLIDGPFGRIINTTAIGLDWSAADTTDLRDTGSGIQEARIQHRNRSFNPNGTVGTWQSWTNATTFDPATTASNTSTITGNDSTIYAYRIKLWDTAGNTNISNSIETGIDQTGPTIQVTDGQQIHRPFNWTNTTTIIPAVNITDLSGLQQPTNTTMNMTFWSETGKTTHNVTTRGTGTGIVEATANNSFNNLNETEIYNITITSTDRHDQYREHNWTIRTDFTSPDLAWERYPANSSGTDWYQVPVTVEQTCSDTTAGFKRHGINQTTSSIQQWNTTSPANTTLTTQGNTSYTVFCEDYAGNRNSSTTHIPIDTTPPTITGTSPTNTSDNQERSFSVTISFTDQQQASGINPSESVIDLNGGDGSITDQTWSNDTVTITVSSLQYATTYTIDGTLNDTAGNTEPVYLTYTTEDEPEPDSGGGGSSSLGGSVSPDTGPSGEHSTSFWEQIDDNTPVDSDLGDNHSSGVTKISVQTNESRDNAAMNVSGQRERPETVTTPSGSTYRYLSIDTRNLPDHLITNASITFSVNRSWIQDNDLNRSTIRLNRYQDQWESLPTRVINQTRNIATFEATTPGFSYFAITAEPNMTPDQTTTTEQQMYCGNGTCDQNETWQNCAIDCDPPQIVSDAREAIQQANQTIPADAPEQTILQQAVEQYNQDNFEQALQLSQAAIDAYQRDPAPDTVSRFLLVIVIALIGTVLAILYHHFRQ